MNIKQLAQKLRHAADVLDELIGIETYLRRNETSETAHKIRGEFAKKRKHRKVEQPDSNPNTGKPYKLSAEARANMSKAARKRVRSRKGRAVLLRNLDRAREARLREVS